MTEYKVAVRITSNNLFKRVQGQMLDWITRHACMSNNHNQWLINATEQ